MSMFERLAQAAGWQCRRARIRAQPGGPPVSTSCSSSWRESIHFLQTRSFMQSIRISAVVVAGSAVLLLTVPAHSSIFTGKFPPAHGVRDNGGFFLDERETTLAERLQSRGFKTGGFVGAYVLDHKWGISQGFQTYFDDFDLSKYQSLSLGSVDRPGNEVADKALAWLARVSSSRFFAWVHFYDAHSPYTPPEPFKSRYARRPYLGEIAFVDSQVGRLLAFLDDHDLTKKTIVLVMGDHGE